MTPQVRDRLLDTLVKAAMVLVPIGMAWGILTSQVSGKLDASRFVTDSTRRDAAEQTDHAILLRIDERVRAMYCTGKPPGCQ